MATPLGTGLDYFDLNFLGHPEVIATGLLSGRDGVALIDPGPSTTLATLKQALAGRGIALADVRSVLITHIHLDHAGATGSLVGGCPNAVVYVHERGAPHLADPSKLISSASRLYGDDMARLWGEILPVPADRIKSLSATSDTRLIVAGHNVDVTATPGHASHHVSFFSGDTGIAFVGDTAGVRLQPGRFIVPPTPPPDIDLEAWRVSFARIAAWHPETLFLTHFGPHAPVAAHLTEMADHLEMTSGLAKASLARDGTDEDREAWFTDQLRLELRRRMGESEAHAYEVAGRFDLNWRGLARYWRKRN